MKTENRRREDMSKAQTEESRESLVPFLNRAMVDKAEKEPLILPSDHDAYITTIENVVDDCNMQRAVAKVKSNKGAPGIDGVTTEEISEVMQKQWLQIKRTILDGKYSPSPVRTVEIPKPDGSGVRQLGIPTVMDRIIQQAIHQELVPVFDPNFSQYSYGFRPN